jgi:hypothetical protein
VKEENILTLKLKLTLFFLGVKEENILTLKLKLTLFFLGVKEENILTLKLKLTLFFLGVKEENILTLKPTLTLFFCGFEYERFTLAFSSHAPEAHTLKPTLFFAPRRSNWIIWDNQVLGNVILENNKGRWKQYTGVHYSIMINFYSKR